MRGGFLKGQKNMVKNKINELGRSMIEMLGVLSVVGVISVGGIKVISGAIQSQQYTQAITDAAQLADDGRRLVCDYRDDTGYSGGATPVSYGIFLYKSDKYPHNLTYDTTNNVYTGEMDMTYAVSTVNTNGAFKITISGIPQELCIRMASNDWGSRNSSGFSGIKINSSTTSTTVLSIADATAACSPNSNSIELSYRGCE